MAFFELCGSCHSILTSPKFPCTDGGMQVAAARGGIPMEVYT